MKRILFYCVPEWKPEWGGNTEFYGRWNNEKEVKTITKIIQEEMTSVTESDLHSFSTPLTVDVNTGDNWGILH